MIGRFGCWPSTSPHHRPRLLRRNKKTRSIHDPRGDLTNALTEVSFNRHAEELHELIGRLTTMLVPRPSAVRTSNCAPRFWALACILDNPKPSRRAASG